MSNASNISPDNFAQNYSVKVVRYDLYPADSPTCYCTGFQITNNNNNRTMYVDTQIPLTDLTPETSDDNSIVQMGWNQVKDQVMAWATSIQNTSGVINSTFNPIF